jgi:hypothetical protein
MGLVAVLAETGVSRRLLHLAAETGVLGAGPVGAGEVDAGVGDLADASLLGFTGDGGSVLAHRLVMRVARERLAADGALSLVLCGAIRVLGDAVEAIGEPLRDRAWIRELTGQVNAVIACMEGHPGGDATAHALSVYLLNELNEKNALATSLAAGELLAEYSKGRRKGWRRWLTSNTHP